MLLLLPLLLLLLLLSVRLLAIGRVVAMVSLVDSVWSNILYEGMNSFLGASRLLFTLTITFGRQIGDERQVLLADDEFEELGLPVDDGDGLALFLYICSIFSRLSSKLSFFFLANGGRFGDLRRWLRDLLSELLLLLSSSLANC